MERGQSTVEVAIAFPVAVTILWWTIVAPLVGVRALAARVAAATGARQAALADGPEAGRTGRTIERMWKGLGGAGSGKKVEVSLSNSSVAVSAREAPLGAGRMSDFLLYVGREKD
ncbi:MAG: hypothetical protein QME79_02820 [Bacillota bacterium]|nr:hypothetical protein [Bacillota bacterium]